MHEVVRYCYEYQLLRVEAAQGSLPEARRERLEALARLLADPEEGQRSFDRVTLRCAGSIQLASGPEPVCVLDFGAGGLSVVVSSPTPLAEGMRATVIISDVKRGTDYCFECTITRVEPDPAGRRVGMVFAGRPSLQRRGGGLGKRDDDSMPEIDLDTFKTRRREGLLEVMTPPGGTPRAKTPPGDTPRPPIPEGSAGGTGRPPGPRR